ncbi:hypothetical protein [Mycetocola sp. 2940]
MDPIDTEAFEPPTTQPIDISSIRDLSTPVSRADEGAKPVAEQVEEQ